MSNEQLQRQYYNVLMDAWNALKPKVVDVTDAGFFWDEAIHDFNEIAAKYYGTPVETFAHHISLGCLAGLESRFRELYGGLNDANKS